MEKYKPLISLDQAFIISLKMHDRGHCGLLRAVIAGMELRYQLNFLDQLGISLDCLKKWLKDAQEGDVI